MTRQYPRTLCLALLLLMLPGLASAVREGRLIGKVVDPEGNPIAGVVVTATSDDLEDFREVMTTNKKGIFKLDFDHLHVTYRYRFEKAGYQTTGAEQKWSFQGTRRHEFTMQPGASPVNEELAPASTSALAIQAFNNAVTALEGKDHTAAAERFEEALKHDPGLRQAWEALSLIYLEREQWQQAVRATEQAVALGSTDVSVLRARWEAYRNLGDEAQAAAASTELERLGRLSEEARRIHNEGVALSKAGDPEGAFTRFQEAVAIDPNLTAALIGIATTGLKIGKVAEAAGAAEALLEASPGDEQALRLRYNAALQLGDEAKVVDALVGLAAIEPATASASLLKLAVAAFDADDAAKAKERFGKLLEIDAHNAPAHYFLGMLTMREGAQAKARRYLERFLELAPDDANADTARQLLKHLKP